MKSVLISIQPRWVEKILSGEKTVEVRKTAPKLETPFKCYIYETKGKTEMPWMDEDGHMIFQGRGMVIGEFTCDRVEFLDEWDLFKGMDEVSESLMEEHTCLSIDELLTYKGNRQEIYGWHISELKIYDKPKELREFCIMKKCNACKVSGYEASACIYDEDCKVPAVITRPPQSWCYVEG